MFLGAISLDRSFDLRSSTISAVVQDYTRGVYTTLKRSAFISRYLISPRQVLYEESARNKYC